MRLTAEEFLQLIALGGLFLVIAAPLP